MEPDRHVKLKINTTTDLMPAALEEPAHSSTCIKNSGGAVKNGHNIVKKKKADSSSADGGGRKQDFEF